MSERAATRSGHDEGCRAEPDGAEARRSPAVALESLRQALEGTDDGHPRGLLIEAAAENHSFAELAPAVRDPWLLTLLAHERVLRGEEMSEAAAGRAEPLGVPLSLQAWEPQRLAAVQGVSLRRQAWEPVAGSAPQPADATTHRGWRQADDDLRRIATEALLVHWQEQRVVHRSRTSDPTTATDAGAVVRLLPTGQALARLAWAASYGGERGARRSGAVARIELWRFLAECCALSWPPEPDALAARLPELGFWEWESSGCHAEPVRGRFLSVVIGSPAGWVCSLRALDTPRAAAPERRGRAPGARDVVARRLFVGQDWGRLADLITRDGAAPQDGQRSLRPNWPVGATRWGRSPTHTAALLEHPALRDRLPRLTSTAAEAFDWPSLGPQFTDPETASWFAQERVVWGEDLRGLTGTNVARIGLPPVLRPWEPDYFAPDFGPYPVGEPQLPPAQLPVAPCDAPPAAAGAAGPAGAALRRAVSETLAACLGTAFEAPGEGVVLASGGPREALAALGFPGRLQCEGTDAGAVVHRLARAYLNRAPTACQSLALARYRAWRAVAACTDLPWPPEPEALADAAGRLRWLHWTPPGLWLDDDERAALPGEDRGPSLPPAFGGGHADDHARWWLGIAVTDPRAGWTAAVCAWSEEKIR